MVLTTIAGFISGTFALVTSSVDTLLTVNYYFAQGLIVVASWMYSTLYTLVVTCWKVLHVFFEDLALFIGELIGSLSKFGDEIMFSYEMLFHKVACGLSALHVSSVTFVEGCLNLANDMTAGVLVSTKDFVELVGSSFILLLSVFPNTLSLIFRLALYVASEVSTCIESCKRKFFDLQQMAFDAPTEFTIGLLTCLIVFLTTYKLTTKFITDYNVTRERTIIWIVSAVCFAYEKACLFVLNIINTILSFFGGIKNFFLGRRQDKLQLNKMQLFENLIANKDKLARPDRLCVICQDREKTVMMMPCRHLCICETCKSPLLRTTRNRAVPGCPMCRTAIDRTVKVYF